MICALFINKFLNARNENVQNLCSNDNTPTLFREEIHKTIKNDWWEVLFYETHWNKMVNSYKAELNFLSITFSLIAAMTYPIVFNTFEELQNEHPNIRKCLIVSIATGFFSSLAALIFVMHSFVVVNLSTNAEEVHKFFSHSMFIPILNISLMKMIEAMTRVCIISCMCSCCLYAYCNYPVNIVIAVVVIALITLNLIAAFNFSWEIKYNKFIEEKRQFHLNIQNSSKEHIEYTECLYKLLLDLEAEGYFGAIYRQCPEAKDLAELMKVKVIELARLLDAPLHLAAKIKRTLGEHDQHFLKQNNNVDCNALDGDISRTATGTTTGPVSPNIKQAW